MTAQMDFDEVIEAVANNPQPLAQQYRATIRAAIKADALAHGGVVDQGRVRRSLTGPHGLTVPPRLLAAQYGAMRAEGLLRRDGWHVNDDTAGRNGGKMQPRWLWAGGS